jgi:hypothetical protein
MSDAQYFAQLDDNNVVITVAVVTAEFMAENSDRYPGTWVETFFDTPGKVYAGPGFTYNPATQNFEYPIVPDPIVYP